MTRNEMKKSVERFFLDAARSVSPIFPAGEVLESEEPDFKICTLQGELGIEVSELLAFTPSGFVSRQAASYQAGVVEQAWLEYSRFSAEPADVLAFCSEVEPQRAPSKAQMAHWLARFVSSKIKKITRCETFNFGNYSSNGFSVVRVASPILEIPARWQAGYSGSGVILDWESVNREIQKKNGKLCHYTKCSLGNWLLLFVDMTPATATFWIPSEVDQWRFSFDFERVLLFDRMYGRVINLAHQ